MFSAVAYGYYPIFDKWYFILIVPALILALVAQGLVKSRFKTYSQVSARSGYTGAAAARRILDESGLSGVRVERVAGSLTDHYSPREKILRLSEATHDSTSIAAIGVAAHEAGHAIQDDLGYAANKIRAFLVPVAGIGSAAGPYLAIFGIALSFPLLTNIGILLYLGAVLFYLVTLPVEFNASSRAMALLGESGMLTGEEQTGARKVLNAAALTYVASALTALMSLLRLILLARGRRNRS